VKEGPGVVSSASRKLIVDPTISSMEMGMSIRLTRFAR
jgi:hypothetical protein